VKDLGHLFRVVQVCIQCPDTRTNWPRPLPCKNWILTLLGSHELVTNGLCEMKRYYRAYIFSATWVLIATSLAKLYSTTGSAKVLDIPEVLLPMTIRQALWLLGSVELLIAVYLFRGTNNLIKLVCVCWLSSNFLLYRLAAVMLTVGKPCPCLGSITEKLPLKPATIDRLLNAVVLYLFFGSLFFLIALWKRKPLADGLTPQGAPAESEV